MTKKRASKKRKTSSQVEAEKSDAEEDAEEDAEDHVALIKEMQAEIRSLRVLYEEQVALSTKLGLDVQSQTQKLTEVMNDRPSVSKKTTIVLSAECKMFLSTWEASNSNLKVCDCL